MPMQWLAVALIALAPLACIEFCRVTHQVAHRTHLQGELLGSAGHDAPLNDMQQLVHNVTDALPMLATWAALLIVMALRIDLRVNTMQVAHAPPTPPPKMAVPARVFVEFVL